ncbi:hypothetical protein EDB89DRAFT_549955 [Lactarius sanguifluus]|nr:hypothetical protein EDB89DRAFT_549955 [Lactarius sanguifluus]
MGKWTSEYYDDVLGAKIKSLVSGAVKRSKLEKSEPSISYEAFVEDLDPGDSFTTTLTELLVREMAERRHRQVAADRRLISDRTAKGLRTLAAPQRVYRDRGVRGLASRRSLNLTDYLVVPPEEMELDDDNDSLESAVEGARINYDLYDAYTNPTGLSTAEPHFSPPPPHLRHVLRSTRRESWGTLRDASPDAWGPPPPATATAVLSAPPLTRQPSIRRVPARSRTVDFTDFTSRRRSSGREASHSATAGDPEADDSATTTSPSTFPPLSAIGMPPRRFFPSRRPELPWSPLPESTSSSTSANSTPNAGTGLVAGTGTATGAGAMQGTRLSPAPVPVPAPAPTPAHTDAPRDQRTFLSWLPSSALLQLPPPPPTDPRSSPRTTPRLRRGGVRPPESLLPRSHVTLLRTESPEPLGVEGGAVPMAVSAPSPVSLDPRLGLSSPAPAE